MGYNGGGFSCQINSRRISIRNGSEAEEVSVKEALQLDGLQLQLRLCCVVFNVMLRLEMIINQELEIKRYTNCFPRFCFQQNYSYKEQFIGRFINLKLKLKWVMEIAPLHIWQFLAILVSFKRKLTMLFQTWSVCWNRGLVLNLGLTTTDF